MQLPCTKLEVGQIVVARDYTGAEKWKEGVIRARTGPLSYEVEVVPHQIWRRHIDQLSNHNQTTKTEFLLFDADSETMR